MAMRCGDSLNDLLHKKRICIEFFRQNDSLHLLDVHFYKIMLGRNIQTYAAARMPYRTVSLPDLLPIVFLHQTEDSDEIETVDGPIFLFRNRTGKVSDFSIRVGFHHSLVYLQIYFFAFFSEQTCYGLDTAALESHFLRQIGIEVGRINRLSEKNVYAVAVEELPC